jgi:hypothetical protein
MTVNITIIYQTIMTVLQVLNAVNVTQLPPKWQGVVTAVITVLQGVEGILAHFYTPSGVMLTQGATVQTKEAVGTQSAR